MSIKQYKRRLEINVLVSHKSNLSIFLAGYVGVFGSQLVIYAIGDIYLYFRIRSFEWKPKHENKVRLFYNTNSVKIK